MLVDHTSTHQPFIVPSTVVMETESMWHGGGGSGGQGLWGPGPCMAPPWLASFLLRHTHTHSFTHTHYCTQPVFLSLSGFDTHIYTIMRELGKPHRSENTHRPCIPSNGRKSWTWRAHLEKYLRFWRNWDHLISE